MGVALSYSARTPPLPPRCLETQSSPLPQRRRVMRDVIANERRDEVVAVVVPRPHP